MNVLIKDNDTFGFAAHIPDCHGQLLLLREIQIRRDVRRSVAICQVAEVDPEVTTAACPWAIWDVSSKSKTLSLSFIRTFIK